MNFKHWLIVNEETNLENPDIWDANTTSGIVQHFLGFLHDNHINAINPNDMKFILDIVTDNPKLYKPKGSSGEFDKETAARDNQISNEFKKTKQRIVEILFKAYKIMTPEQQNQYKELFENKSKLKSLKSAQEEKEKAKEKNLDMKKLVNMSDQEFEEFEKLDNIKKMIMMKKLWQKNANREEWNNLKIVHWERFSNTIDIITGKVRPKELSATYYPPNQDMSKIGENFWFQNDGVIAFELKGNVTSGFFMDGATDNFYDPQTNSRVHDSSNMSKEKIGGRAWTLKPVFRNDAWNELLIQDYKIIKLLIYDSNFHKNKTKQEEPEEIRKSYEYVEKIANEYGIPVEHIKTS